jgi:hypothetical protein
MGQNTDRIVKENVRIVSLLVGTSRREGLFGKPSRKWKDNIKMDIKKTKYTPVHEQ